MATMLNLFNEAKWIQKAIKNEYGLKRLPSREKMQSMSSRWNPYRSIAALYLWKSRD
jgi:DNA-3-methyladenine glycosylase II